VHDQAALVFGIGLSCGRLHNVAHGAVARRDLPRRVIRQKPLVR
jgi:hypothetical protein